MLDAVRKYVEAGMGALSSKRAEALARKLVEQGQTGKEQVGRVARELIEWSRKSGERLAGLIRQEVRKQITSLGVASKSEVEALRKRVAELEGGRKTTRKKTTAKKSPAKKTTAKKTSAKKTTARKRT